MISYALGNDAVPSYHGTCENWSVNSGIIPFWKERFTAAVRIGGGMALYSLSWTWYLLGCQQVPGLAKPRFSGVALKGLLHFIRDLGDGRGDIKL